MSIKKQYPLSQILLKKPSVSWLKLSFERFGGLHGSSFLS